MNLVLKYERVADPLPSITQSSNPAFVLASEVGLIVILVEMAPPQFWSLLIGIVR